MKRGLLIAGMVTLVAVLAVFATRPASSPLEDPVINGKPVSDWVMECFYFGNTNAWTVVSSNRAMAIPHLIARFENRERAGDQVRIRLAGWLRRFSPRLAARIDPKRSQEGWMLLGSFLRLGPDPRLTDASFKALKDRDLVVRSRAALNLYPLLTEDISPMIEGLKLALDDVNEYVRANTCARIRRSAFTKGRQGFGTNAFALCDKLKQLAEADPSENVRANAAAALLELNR